MATASDIKLIDNSYEFSNGDFIIDESDNQHQADIISENAGAYKQFPLVGVGIVNYLNSSGSQLVLKREIQTQLETDGYRVDEIVFNEDDTSNFTVYAVRN